MATKRDSDLNPEDVLMVTPEGISITQARRLLTQLPERLAEIGSAVPLTRRGQPVMALMPWDLFEAIQETLEILADPGQTAALQESIRDIQEGRVLPWEKVKEELEL